LYFLCVFLNNPDFFGYKTDKKSGGKAAEADGKSEDLPRQIALFPVDREIAQ